MIAGFWQWILPGPFRPVSAWARCHLRLGVGGLRADAAALNNPAALPNCRESPSLWWGLRRPGATRRPWHGSPLRRPPDGLPASSSPPLGPAHGAHLGVPFGRAVRHTACHRYGSGRLALSVQRSPTLTTWRKLALVGPISAA